MQPTLEEMPAALAVLMNRAESVRFDQHGAERDKFIELRRQAGGLVVVTDQGGAVYAVPVKAGALYYLLGLFARALAQGLPGASLADVLALVWVKKDVKPMLGSAKGGWILILRQCI